tara:strand:- start:372 stop:605 length:234 start_codon:yes stop_codon:yes gene_type:complete
MIVAILLSFSIGFTVGSYFKASVFDNQDWQCLRWDGNIFGYRPVAFGSRIKKGEKVMMALKLNTHDIPAEGILYEED